MNQFQTETHTPAWLSALISEEVGAESNGIISIPSEDIELELLDKSSIEFMDSIRVELEKLILIFNKERAANQADRSIKFFKIANTVNDFMIYRKSLKMIFTRRAVDLISIQINRGNINIMDLSQHENIPENSHWEIQARIGEFSQVEWLYRNQPFKLNDLVQFLLTLFVRSSMA